MPVTGADITAFIDAYAAVIAEHRVELTELDAAIGDADHGENMNRGFSAAVDKLAETPGGAPSDQLKAVAMTLITKVGGAAGPLYGTAFLGASTATAGKQELDATDVVACLEAGLAGIVRRGKAVVGDKTMVDAWTPAVAAIRAQIDAGASLADALAAGEKAAKEGMDSVTPLVARKGRASYLGERSAGHIDPGAMSSWLLFDTLAKQVQ